jgi:hypothetical protein
MYAQLLRSWFCNAGATRMSPYIPDKSKHRSNLNPLPIYLYNDCPTSPSFNKGRLITPCRRVDIEK